MSKIIYYFGLLLLFFLAPCYAFYTVYQSVTVATINQLNDHQMTCAKLAAKGIESFFSNYFDSLKILSEDNPIINLNNDGIKLLKSFYNINSNKINAVSRVYNHGNIIYTFPETEFIGLIISNQPFSQEVIKTLRPAVSDVNVSEKGYEIIASQVPIINNGLFDGYVSVFINFEAVAKKYLEDIKTGLNGYAWMISQKGIELYCPVPGHTGKSVFENYKDFPTILSMAKKILEGKERITTYQFDQIQDKT